MTTVRINRRRRHGSRTFPNTTPLPSRDGWRPRCFSRHDTPVHSSTVAVRSVPCGRGRPCEVREWIRDLNFFSGTVGPLNDATEMKLVIRRNTKTVESEQVWYFVEGGEDMMVLRHLACERVQLQFIPNVVGAQGDHDEVGEHCCCQ